MFKNRIYNVSQWYLTQNCQNRVDVQMCFSLNSLNITDRITCLHYGFCSLLIFIMVVIVDDVIIFKGPIICFFFIKKGHKKWA